MDVVVKHAFVARGEGELTAKEGELLELIKKDSSTRTKRLRSQNL